MPYYGSEPGGPVFSAPFQATAFTTEGPSDLFCITAPSSSFVEIREIRLGQYTEFADAQAELLALLLLVGSTLASGGAAITPRNVQRHTGAPTALASISGPSTTVASTASAVLSVADSFNVAAGWWYRPERDERLIIPPGGIAMLRMSTPNDGLTMNGTLTFKELGKVIGR